jgi:hypothetical protein
MNTFVSDFFAHCESASEDFGWDWETIDAMKKEWEEWKKEKKFDNVVKKEIKKVEKKVEKKESKPKKAKDAPKNARSAYILFSQDMRPVVKEEQPTLDSKDVLRALGALWKQADEDTKKKYQELAEEDKGRFKSEMETYVPSVEEKVEKGKKQKKPKDAPKNAKSGYMFYCAEIRAVVKEENPDMKPQEIMSEMGRRWKEVKDTEEAKKYLKMAEEDKERYATEKKAYDEKNGVEVVKKVEKKKEDGRVDMIRDIIESFGEEQVTIRKIKEKLKERDVEIEKDELKEIVNRIMEDE